nr:hypothetical protein GCM10020241_28190 [Streptoalloteichus tenebrarius]
MGLAVEVGVARGHPDLEVGLDLGHEGHVLAGELAPRALQGDQVGVEEPAAVLGQLGARQLGPQLARPRREGGGPGPGFVGDLAAQRRVPGVRVHESLDEPVEPEAEQEVLPHELAGVHGPAAYGQTRPGQSLPGPFPLVIDSSTRL